MALAGRADTRSAHHPLLLLLHQTEERHPQGLPFLPQSSHSRQEVTSYCSVITLLFTKQIQRIAAIIDKVDP